ncbi:MAG: chloride channel protein [Bacteroidia bacterium]
MAKDIINQILAGKFDAFMKNIPFQNLFSYNTLFILFIFITILLKPIAAGLTISAGGNGGIFAPSLFNGALTGLLTARIINTFLPEPINELNLVIAGMAGLLSGVVSAPLTGIFMIAEVSGGYSLFIPLMLVSAISFFTTRLFEPSSIYNKRLAELGKLNASKDEAILENINILEITEKGFIVFYPEQYIKEIKNIVGKTNSNIYIVLNHDETLAGALTFNDLKPVLFDYSLLEKSLVKDLMQTANIVLNTNDNLLKVKKVFEDYENEYYLPVQDEKEKFVGLVSKSQFLNKYKELVQEVIGE